MARTLAPLAAQMARTLVRELDLAAADHPRRAEHQRPGGPAGAVASGTAAVSTRAVNIWSGLSLGFGPARLGTRPLTRAREPR
jgi:hypothetical protein